MFVFISSHLNRKDLDCVVHKPVKWVGLTNPKGLTWTELLNHKAVKDPPISENLANRENNMFDL